MEKIVQLKMCVLVTAKPNMPKINGYEIFFITSHSQATLEPFRSKKHIEFNVNSGTSSNS